MSEVTEDSSPKQSVRVEFRGELYALRPTTPARRERLLREVVRGLADMEMAVAAGQMQEFDPEPLVEAVQLFVQGLLEGVTDDVARSVGLQEVRALWAQVGAAHADRGDDDRERRDQQGRHDDEAQELYQLGRDLHLARRLRTYPQSWLAEVLDLAAADRRALQPSLRAPLFDERDVELRRRWAARAAKRDAGRVKWSLKKMKVAAPWTQTRQEIVGLLRHAAEDRLPLRATASEEHVEAREDERGRRVYYISDRESLEAGRERRQEALVEYIREVERWAARVARARRAEAATKEDDDLLRSLDEMSDRIETAGPEPDVLLAVAEDAEEAAARLEEARLEAARVYLGVASRDWKAYLRSERGDPTSEIVEDLDFPSRNALYQARARVRGAIEEKGATLPE